MDQEAGVGFAIGSFDLFGLEDLLYLRASRRDSDHLVVGVVSDEVVEEMTGKAPIMSLIQRIQIVASMREVDEAVPLMSKDLVAAWQYVKFDTLFLTEPNSMLHWESLALLRKTSVTVVSARPTTNGSAVG